MAKVKFKRIQNSSQIDDLPIEDGSFVITGDGKSYIDYGNNRVPTNGTLDDEMSDLSSNAVENKVIKEYVDDSKQEAINYGKPVVLWTNPNPDSAFSSQQISLSSGDWSYLEIYYYDWTADVHAWKDVMCQKVIKGYSTKLIMILSYNNKSYIGNRRVRYVDSTTLQVDLCYCNVDLSAFNDRSETTWCVPMKIVGYK